MKRFHPRRRFAKHAAFGFLSALFLLAILVEPARAWDIWLVTTHNRILVIHDVETAPHQGYLFTHDDVPDAHTRYGYFGLGDIGFSPNGKLYGVSLALEQKAHLYILDPTTGHLTQLTPALPFEWGNALEFNPRSGLGFTGGGLESYHPYRYLKGFYTFQNGSPATITLWHDMRPDYPQGGYTAGSTWANGYFYAPWGQGNWNNHQTYLLQITTDAAENFVSYTNLGAADANDTLVQVVVPAGSNLTASQASLGTFDPTSGLWSVGTLPTQQSATLTLTLRPQTPGDLTLQAQVTRAGPIDPDSVASLGFNVDDWHDGQPDDDEATLTLHVVAPPPSHSSLLLPVTGFPHTTTALPPQQRPYRAFPLTLEIPALGLRAPIVGVPQGPQGWDVRWLGNTVGWLEGTAFPTWAGNTVLTGHVWNADNTPGIFLGLKRLRFGDAILIHAWGLTYTYTVQENRLLRPNDTAAALEHESRDWLTLLTCEDYTPATSEYRYRRMVRAVLTAIK